MAVYLNGEPEHYVPNPVLVIIDVQPKELGILTKAYCAVKEVKEVLRRKNGKYGVGGICKRTICPCS
ncbi:hypothetical protein LguiA_008308 [Lonicera macranthoides]